MARIKLILKAIAAAFAAVLYVWYAAVRLAPAARRRRRAKAAGRRRQSRG